MAQESAEAKEEEFKKAAVLSSVAGKQRARRMSLQILSALARMRCLTTLERTIAGAWKPDCRGLRSEWVERKWRQRV